MDCQRLKCSILDYRIVTTLFNQLESSYDTSHAQGLDSRRWNMGLKYQSTYHSSIFSLLYTSSDEPLHCKKRFHQFLILFQVFYHLDHSSKAPLSYDNNCQMINSLLILAFQNHQKYDSRHVSVSGLEKMFLILKPKY